VRQPSSEMRAVKDAVRARDGNACVGCGMTNAQHLALYGKRLLVHRKNPGSLYCVDACETRCVACHGPLPRRKPGQPDLAYGNATVTLFLRLPAAHRRTLEELARRHRRTLTAEAMLAFEQHLAANGT
jgi:hypothetical protein